MSAEQPAHPSPCDLIITNGRILDLDAEGSVVDGHDIVIDHDTIVAVRPNAAAEWAPKRTIDADGCVVSPGFVDGHVHLSAFLATAAAYVQPTGEGVFSGGSNVAAIVPFVAQMTTMPLPTEFTATVLKPAFAAMVKNGITSVVDAGSSGHAGIVQAAREVGIRAAIGPSLADSWHNGDGKVVRQADHHQLIEEARAWLEHTFTADTDLVGGLISAVETIACSDELLRGIAELADDLDLPTNIHSHITSASDEAHIHEYGRSATDRLLDTGMLTSRLTAMHAGNATDSDIEAFLNAGITVNHNPLGNAMFGFATVRNGAILRMQEAGVPIVLGSDYAPRMTPNPFESMRAALVVHREAVGTDIALTLEDVLAMATNPGASVGRPGEVGRIAVGQLADIVVLDTSGPHHLGDRHPVPSAALRAQTSDVKHVVINGQIVVDDGRVSTVDTGAAVTEAQSLLASLQ